MDYYEVLGLPTSAGREELRQALSKELKLWSWRARSPFFAKHEEAQHRLKLLIESRKALLDLTTPIQGEMADTLLAIGFPLGTALSDDGEFTGLVRVGQRIISMPADVYEVWLSAHASPSLDDFAKVLSAYDQTVDEVVTALTTLEVLVCLPQELVRAAEMLQHLRLLPTSYSRGASDAGAELESASGHLLATVSMDVYLTLAYSDGVRSVYEASQCAAEDLDLPLDMILARVMKALPPLVRSRAACLDGK